MEYHKISWTLCHPLCHTQSLHLQVFSPRQSLKALTRPDSIVHAVKCVRSLPRKYPSFGEEWTEMWLSHSISNQGNVKIRSSTFREGLCILKKKCTFLENWGHIFKQNQAYFKNKSPLSRKNLLCVKLCVFHFNA